jgi:hypothetical protein
MPCPHRSFSTCDNCIARYQYGDDFLRSQDNLARKRQAERQAAREKERGRREERWAAANRGPSPTERIAAKISAQGAAAKAAKVTARATQPFNLFWYERVGVVAGIVVLGLMLLSELPTPVLLLVLVVGGFAVWRTGARPWRGAARAAGRFIRGERRRVQPPRRPGPAA